MTVEAALFKDIGAVEYVTASVPVKAEEATGIPGVWRFGVETSGGF